MTKRDRRGEGETKKPRAAEVETEPGRRRWAELKQAQQALAESEALFRATFEQAPVGIVHGDLTGRIRRANRRIAELFGYEPGDPDFLKLRLWECTHPGDLWTVDRFKKLLAGEISDYTVEKRYLRRDGSMWWASVRCSMARADDGHPKYFIVIVEDITSSKATEEELEAKVAQRTAELEAANTALKVMLNHRAEEKREVEEEVAASVGQLVMPFLERLLTSGLTPNQRALAEAVRSGVTEITSPLAHRLSSKLVGLTPKELEVARLVKDGKNSSEIAQLLSISHNAVAFHRQNIRAKLGLKRKKVNLCSYLMQMSDR
jgi:PAS domain S-box-containing protein